MRSADKFGLPAGKRLPETGTPERKQVVAFRVLSLERFGHCDIILPKGVRAEAQHSQI
jgi:hypothetical protein